MTFDELMSYIFAGQTHRFAAQFAEWATDSARFRAFAEIYRDKIRKKIRGIKDEPGLRDLQFELEIAYLLLQERRFTVEYEKYGVGKQRSADFLVTFRANLPFNVEVKRMRAGAEARAEDLREPTKLINTVCAKLGQLIPNTINLLALSAGGLAYRQDDIDQTMKLLKQHDDRKDEEYFTRRGFASARDFLHGYEHLSAIMIWHGWDDDGPPVIWLNKLARRPLPANLYTILRQ